MASPPTKNIVVLGSSYAGLSVAHLLADSIIPTLPKDKFSYKVTIISPTTSFYWSISSPRLILGDDKLNPKKDQVFSDINTAFKKKYGDGSGKDGKVRWEFIAAWARDVNPEKKVLEFERIPEGDAPQSSLEFLEYDQLVVATGSRPHNQDPVTASSPVDFPPPPFKSHGTTTDTKAALSAWSKLVSDADKILLSGAGPTGVEVAGEIAFQYPGKKIILINSGKWPLPMCLEKVGKAAENILKGLNIEIRNSVKVERAAKASDGTGVEVMLSTGEVIKTDLYIPTHHAFLPNTEFLRSAASKSSEEKNGVLAANQYLTVTKYLNTPGYSSIWGIGDVNDIPDYKRALCIDDQLWILAGNLKKTLLAGANGDVGVEVKGLEEFIWKAPSGMFVPIGRSKGTGQFGTWKVWSIIIWFLKGRAYFVGNMPGIVTGMYSMGHKKLTI